MRKISRRVADLVGLRALEEVFWLDRLSREELAVGRLRSVSAQALKDMLSAVDRDEIEAVAADLDARVMPEAAGGVNPGDRRALYALVRSLRPRRVLEIGTHIGASTSYIAAALLRSNHGADVELVTVDVRDVNNPIERPWEEFGASISPLRMLEELGYREKVRFIRAESPEYFRDSEETFDFVFLDGNHAASTVYREVPAAARALNPWGVVLLHDYFPDGKPLWRDGKVAHGPVQALARLQHECPQLEVLPLGRLPWATKLDSHASSLALLARR